MMMIFYKGKIPKGFKTSDTPKAKPSKYKNKKVTVDGITFDSQLESYRYQELRLLERAGKITDLKRQVKYTLIPSQKINGKVVERECCYYADFTYTDANTGEFVCEDAKGMKTKEYKIKKKLMLYIFGIEIKEVTR